MWLTLGSTTRELRNGEVVVGSGADADWRIPTADLMPRHFTVTVYDLNASLKPTTRDNVVAVNGKQVASTCVLHDGDVILAGNGRFLFCDEAPRSAPDDSSPSRTQFLINETARVTHELRSRSTTIGRDASNGIVVRDPAASRFHAEIRREAGGFVLHSMGSAGTTLNGRKLEGPALLGDGDQIHVAYTPFRFTGSAPAEIPLSDGPTNTRDSAARHPTLSTGKISVVPKEGSKTIQVIVGLILVLAVAVAFLVSR